MGKYAVEQFLALKEEFPNHILKVTGTGLLYAVQLNKEAGFTVVAADGAEWTLRRQGLGVIHGGDNALRFTPHFKITKAEIDLQVTLVRAYLERWPDEKFQLLQAGCPTFSAMELQRFQSE